MKFGSYIFIAVSAAFLLVSACNSGGGVLPVVPDVPSEGDIVREVVREAVKTSLGTKYPDVPTEDLVDCIIDNATDDEIGDIAGATALESDIVAVSIVGPILKRPETLICLSEKASN